MKQISLSKKCIKDTKATVASPPSGLLSRVCDHPAFANEGSRTSRLRLGQTRGHTHALQLHVYSGWCGVNRSFANAEVAGVNEVPVFTRGSPFANARFLICKRAVSCLRSKTPNARPPKLANLWHLGDVKHLARAHRSGGANLALANAEPWPVIRTLPFANA